MRSYITNFTKFEKYAQVIFSPISYSSRSYFYTLFSKIFLIFTLLLLFLYSFDTKALSATTVNTIQGTPPYLTFDGGATKSVNVSELLWLELSDGTRYTVTNISSPMTPIELLTTSETLANVTMLVPTTSNSISLNDEIISNNYWGDDDGDGKGENGVSVSGTLNVTITDINNQAVNRTDALDICKSPYKVQLSSTAGNLTTNFGNPNTQAFTGSNAIYYIKPKQPAKICFARPIMTNATGKYAGPTDMWDTKNGFIPQSTTQMTYASNFPTTGANGLYFDLVIGGVSTALNWPSVTKNGITATMTNSTPTSVRVTLTGPARDAGVPEGAFPAQFELVGNDGTTTLKYGFELQKWFIHVGNNQSMVSADQHAKWCVSQGYRQSTVEDLTNANGSVEENGVTYPFPSAVPKSDGNYIQRRINGGLFSEWDNPYNYNTEPTFFVGPYMTSDATNTKRFSVMSAEGSVVALNPNPPNIFTTYLGICTYPKN